MAIHSFQGELSNTIQVAHNVAYKTPAWTMALWVRCFQDTYRPGVFSTSLAGHPLAVGVCWDANLRGLFVDLLNNQSPVADLSNGLWWHVAVAFDATDMRTYANGSPSGYGTVTGLGAMAWGTGPLMLAVVDPGAMLVCLPRIYNRKLSAAEVATLAGGGEVTSGLVARWPASEGSGQTIADDVGGFNATTTGTITWSTDIPTQLVAAPGPPGRAGFSTPLIQGRR